MSCFFASNTVQTNVYGGAFITGEPHGVAVQSRVISTMEILLKANDQRILSSSSSGINILYLAQLCQLSVTFVKKTVENFLERSLVPSNRNSRSRAAGGAGARQHEVVVKAVIEGWHTDHYRTILDYCEFIEKTTGVVVGATTVSGILQRLKMNKYIPSTVPYDRYTTTNQLKLKIYLQTAAGIDPARLVFHDECAVNGKEIGEKCRPRSAPGGWKEPLFVSSSFRTRWQIHGLMRMSPAPGLNPINHFITEENGTAEVYEYNIYSVLTTTAYFQPGDVLVIDGAASHTSHSADVLSSILWNFRSPHYNNQQMKIIVLQLPPRQCIYNPIELVWNIVKMRMAKAYPTFRCHGDLISTLAKEMCNSISPETVERCFRHCGYVK